MYKLIRKTIMIVLILSLCISTVKINAASTSEKIIEYQTELEKINKSLGTKYELIPDENGEYTEILKMSISQFDEYIMKIHQKDENEQAEQETNTEFVCKKSKLSARGGASKQLYYYSGSNYLYFASDITVVNGVLQYLSGNGYGSHISSYPGYKCTGKFSSSFLAGKTKVKCNWKCTRMLSANISDATVYTITCTFKAGGGNVYATHVG